MGSLKEVALDSTIMVEILSTPRILQPRTREDWPAGSVLTLSFLKLLPDDSCLGREGTLTRPPFEKWRLMSIPKQDYLEEGERKKKKKTCPTPAPWEIWVISSPRDLYHLPVTAFLESYVFSYTKLEGHCPYIYPPFCHWKCRPEDSCEELI